MSNEIVTLRLGGGDWRSPSRSRPRQSRAVRSCHGSAGPRLSILTVPEPKTAKNRLHIDFRVPGHGSPDERWERIRAESERLVEAGGNVLDEIDGHHIVMADPEGNEFCVAAASG